MMIHDKEDKRQGREDNSLVILIIIQMMMKTEDVGDFSLVGL